MANIVPKAALYSGPLTDDHFALISRTSFCDMDNLHGGGHGAIYRRFPDGKWRQVNHRVNRVSPEGIVAVNSPGTAPV